MNSSIKKNLFFQTLYQVLTIILPLITAPYVARVVGAAGVGTYSYTYSIASYFALVAKLGINVYGNRTIAMVRDDPEKLNKTFSDLLAVHMGVGFLALAAYVGYIGFFTKEYHVIFIIQGLHVLAELLEVNWLYFGLEKFQLTTTRNIVIRLLALVATFVFVKGPDDVVIYCLIIAGSVAANEVVMWFFVHRYVKIVKPVWKDARKHIKPLLMFFVPSVAISLYRVMDKIMLGSMSNVTQVGFYENSEKIINLTVGLVTALGTVMMPRMSNLAAKGATEESRRYIHVSMRFIMIATLAMAFGLSAVSTVFAPVFFGEEFVDCNVLIAGLSISMPFVAFANVLRTQYLIPNKRDRVFQGSVISGAVVNLCVNYLLIPSMQAMGAVIGTIMAEATVCIIQAVACRKVLPIRRYLLESIPAFVAGAIMLVAVHLIGTAMGTGVLTLIVQVGAGVVIFVGLLGAYMFLTRDEMLGMLTSRLRRRTAPAQGTSDVQP